MSDRTTIIATCLFVLLFLVLALFGSTGCDDTGVCTSEPILLESVQAP